MVKPHFVAPDDEDVNRTEDGWSRFLLDGGLEALAAFRSIQNPAIRAMFIRLMKEAAKAERQSKPGLN